MGHRIAVARTRAGYRSVAAFARALKVNRVTPERWERGETEPKPTQIAQIATLTGTSADWIIRGGEMPKGEPEPPYPSGMARFFADTPEGRVAPPEARRWMFRMVEAAGEAPPGVAFYRTLLLAWQHRDLLTPEEAARTVRETTEARKGE